MKSYRMNADLCDIVSEVIWDKVPNYWPNMEVKRSVLVELLILFLKYLDSGIRRIICIRYMPQIIRIDVMCYANYLLPDRETLSRKWLGSCHSVLHFRWCEKTQWMELNGITYACGWCGDNENDTYRSSLREELVFFLKIRIPNASIF